MKTTKLFRLLCHALWLCLAASHQRSLSQDLHIYSYKDSQKRTQFVVNTLQPIYMASKGFTYEGRHSAFKPPPKTAQLLNAIDHIALAHGIDPYLARAIAHVESGFKPAARSPKGAFGIMQLMPKTASRFGVKDTSNVVENITGGMRYLQYLTGHFKNDYVKVIAAYNAGETAVARYKGVPPYRETQKYVPKVLFLWQTRSIYPDHPPIAGSGLPMQSRTAMPYKA